MSKRIKSLICSIVFLIALILFIKNPISKHSVSILFSSWQILYLIVGIASLSLDIIFFLQHFKEEDEDWKKDKEKYDEEHGNKKQWFFIEAILKNGAVIKIPLFCTKNELKETEEIKRIFKDPAPTLRIFELLPNGEKKELGGRTIFELLS